MELKNTKKEDGTIILDINVPWQDIENTRESVINELVQHVEVAGFRKGKAPRNIAKEKLSKEKVQEELLKRVITKAYNDAVTREKITPIITPRIHVETFDEGTALKFTAETCEEPEIDLKNYKDEVKKVTAKGKIVIPGKEETKVNTEDIISAVITGTHARIPQVLKEQEANRLLSQLLDELKSLGMTLEEYLASRSKKAEELRHEYEEKAEKDLKFEFVLRKIADTEKITVEKTDIEGVLEGIKDPTQKENVTQNPYLLAALIRQQKTLDFLSKI